MREYDIVVVGHGNFSAALIGAAEAIMGRQPALVGASLPETASLESYISEIDGLLADHRPSLVLCDITGGTPYNAALLVARSRMTAGKPLVVCLGGTNLALLLEASLSDEPLRVALMDRLVEVGRSAIVSSPAIGPGCAEV